MLSEGLDEVGKVGQCKENCIAWSAYKPIVSLYYHDSTASWRNKKPKINASDTVKHRQRSKEIFHVIYEQEKF